MTERPDQRYPLTWPAGWPRTPRWSRVRSNFFERLSQSKLQITGQHVDVCHHKPGAH